MSLSSKDTFYVTTPIYYVTAKPHLGSLYSTVIADVLARWHKLQAKEVFFLTGTDEHGQKIAQAAQQAGKEPKAFVDSFIEAYKLAWRSYHIDYTYFIRTTDMAHVRAVQQWLRMLRDKGEIYKSFYKGWYCTSDEMFVAEYANEDDKAPLCPNCARVTTIVSEETYFFRLSAYQDRLLAFYEQHPDFIMPRERRAEVVNFVKGGLKDLSISRTTVKWGIPFPDDDAHVTYVWADALNNYITAVGYAQAEHEQAFNKWWPADVHIMGKDIVRFHAVYWPAFLMASNLPLPHQLLVHGWIKVGAQKMSKSLGNVVDPMELLETYGADAVRYYLMRQLAITHDGEFSIADLEQKITSDLANDLGNLLNRMIILAEKHSAPTIHAPQLWSAASVDLRDAQLTMIEDMKAAMDEFQFHMALAHVWKFINQINAYFHSQEPWKVAKQDPARFNEIISATAHSLHTVAIMLWPIMPQKMEELLAALGVKLDYGVDLIDHCEMGHWAHTYHFYKTAPLFEKPIAQPTEQETGNTSMQTSAPAITFEHFAGVQLAVGTIEQCEPIVGSDKLYRLQVHFGAFGTRQVLSGIRKYYTPQELIGQQAVFVLNLQPRSMMGLESQGMLLTAADEQGVPRLVRPLALVQAGTILK